ncbi:hypothetical protein N0O92_07835 [Alkalihalobacillus sp. MEB130]|uniref:hypothetical protein n=1 Tax=Alkalihalobacillus sp. MEB130 TaxID=2976704 RepID=UPI0028DDBCCF|nr:hypothetical protein [Alkalihalobacillus sp. MEB130]MDT8860141.1 hypothetical protein [Alkalihalobacillus sp. MEB130]
MMLVVFIGVSQLIKLQSGFFESRTTETSEAVGQWVVPCFVILAIYLLGLINYRLIKVALKQQSWVKWGVIALDILLSLIYLSAGAFALFIVTFTYFPFAP